MQGFNGVKVFSATMVADRDRLGERCGEWIRAQRAQKDGWTLTDLVITQSSDEAFHCVALTVFYFEVLAPRAAGGRRVG